MACRQSKIKKMSKGTKSVSKYNTGVKQIVVPEVQMDDQAIKTQTLGGGFAGASTGGQIGGSIGSIFGPLGGTIGKVGGTVVGAGIGAISANQKAKQTQEDEINRINAIKRDNATYKDLGIGDTYLDPKMQSYQQFTKGTKAIEIEAKEAPEIHTDVNFNLKNIGTNSHSNGGTKVQASEGDVIFDTQNSKSKYQSIMNDIKRVKLGDMNAKRRLEKERDSLPKDMPSDGKMQIGNSSVLTDDPNYNWENRGMDPMDTQGQPIDWSALGTQTSTNPSDILTPKSSTQYGDTVQMPGDGVVRNDVNPYDINQAINDITGTTGTSTGLQPSIPTNQPLNPSDIITPKGVTRATSVGADEPITNQEQLTSDQRQEKLQNTLNKVGQVGASAGRLASPLYKYMKSKEKISQPSEVPLNLQRVRYQDTSDVDRSEVDATRRAIERQINRSGLSRGQALGRLAQTSTQAAKQKGAINQREQQLKQAVQQQNVNLTNQERQNLQGQQIRNLDIARQAEGRKESYLGEAMSDFSKLGGLESQKLYMQNRDRKASEMDQKTLQYLLSNNYRINPKTQKLEFAG